MPIDTVCACISTTPHTHFLFVKDEMKLGRLDSFTNITNVQTLLSTYIGIKSNDPSTEIRAYLDFCNIIMHFVTTVSRVSMYVGTPEV
jgi:hypothetical protein